MKGFATVGFFGLGALILTPVLALAQKPDSGTGSEASQGGRRAVDSRTGEFVREPTARDDLDQRLPAEYMPPAGIVEPRSRLVQGTTLWDNGSLVDCAGCGVDGADESLVFDMSERRQTLGFGHQAGAGHRIAADFFVDDPAGWTVRDIRFFAYQTGSGAESTITSVGVRIWNGPPNHPASRVVFDGGAGNRMTASGWTGIYRVEESDAGATNRPIMESVVAINAFLPQGTYWLDWQTRGRLASGPWAPPLGGKGNALHSLDDGASWLPAEDSGTNERLDFPFLIEGDLGEAFIGAAINFVKTVGTSPDDPNADVCWDTDSIFVQAGTEVAYCFEVTNTGSQTLTLHDLDDDQLGSLLQDFPFALSPASAAYLNADVVINSTVTNTATWTAYNPAVYALVSDTDTATVVVANAQPLFCGGPTVAFEHGIPTDWTVVNNAPGNPVVWSNLAGCGEAGNYTHTAGGNAACASSDLQGGGSGLYDTELRTPPFSLAGAASAFLTYRANYQNFAGVDLLWLDISTNGGTSWNSLLSWNDDHGSFRSPTGESVTVDLAAFLGQSNLILRWRYVDPALALRNWYAQIDNVALACNRVVSFARRCSAPGLAIPDSNPAGVVGVVDLGPSWGGINPAFGLNVVVKASHPWVGDLKFALEHVDTGTTVTLIDRPGRTSTGFGCSGDNIDVVIDDSGTGNVETTCHPTPPALSGVLVGGDPPNNTLLKAFDGKEFGGLWALTAADLQGADIGTLNEWCLETDLDGPSCVQKLANTRIDADLFLASCGALDVGPNVVFTDSAKATLESAGDAVRFHNGVAIGGTMAVLNN